MTADIAPLNDTDCFVVTVDDGQYAEKRFYVDCIACGRTSRLASTYEEAHHTLTSHRIRHKIVAFTANLLLGF